ncbi:serine hydrolase [Chitinophaga sp. S165]|uniref:serine hydrolase domain-containing protein n=1 Tax=Chitinophaga sp. S165 TaxID=2135462 RepID=UPI000D7173C4|nr:serine hydrolase domain-containing protein [Chitinophaga sp. S165]PWV46583.1 CubicO group peptidase (beta-lactamase class C family) [Chitinophaga sp. S165]
MKLLSTFLLLTAFSISNLYAQSIPDSTIKKVNALFEKWNKPDGPGCVIGIVRNDSLIYSKGFGLANVEDSVMNTPQSIYYMCSVSKQFAGYSIVLLARQGKVKLDEDIHTYLPWMPDFGKKITVRNLLNHTSGIRDDIHMAIIAGLPMDGMLTQEIALNILKDQRSLNFDPGTKYAYSNSNYVLLSEIVKAVSGRPLTTFADSAIFRPLSMTSTRFVDNPREMIKGRAASYSNDDAGRLGNSYQNVYTLGDGGLFTNVVDMSHWIMNFYTPKAGDSKDIEQLTEKGKLRSGREISYALGVAVDKDRGNRRIIHNGGLAGYRTVITIYPDVKTGFIIFSNAGNGEVYGRVDQLAALFIPEVLTTDINRTTDLTKKDSADAVLKDTIAAKALTGIYYAEDSYQARFTVRDGRLWMNGNDLMIRKAKDTFSLFRNMRVEYAFNRKTESLDLITPVSPGEPIHMVKVHEVPSMSDGQLKNYVGTYYSRELDCNYHITLKDHQLFLNAHKRDPGRITLTGTDHMESPYPLMYHMLILRDANKKIKGFELNIGGTTHLYFEKTR